MAKLSTTGFLLLLCMMGMGIIIYLRLWNVESDLRLEEDTRVDRLNVKSRHWTLREIRFIASAQSEALDEAADWRKMYDEEAEKSSERQQKLVEVTQVLKEKTKQLKDLKMHITKLQQENNELLQDVRRLKRELQDQKLRFEKAGLKAA